MEVCCSLKSVVGGPYSFDRRDRTRYLCCPVQRILTSTSHVMVFQDVGNEVELILAHSTPENINTMTIWVYLLRNIYHQRHLSGPVSYQDFRETGSRAYKRQFTVFLDK